NFLTGPIPDTLPDVPKLKYPDLIGSNFSSEIRALFGRLEKLEVFAVVYNLLDGTLPLFLGNDLGKWKLRDGLFTLRVEELGDPEADLRSSLSSSGSGSRCVRPWSSSLGFLFVWSAWSQRDSLLDYMKQDILLLGGTMAIFQHLYAKSYNADICNKLTTASHAPSLFRGNYYNEKEFPIHIPNKKEDTFLKSGDYGGHADAYIPKGNNLYYYDVNSHYPFLMKEFSMHGGKRPNDALKVFVITAMKHMFLAIHANDCFVYGLRETKKLAKALMDLQHALKDSPPPLLTSLPTSPDGRQYQPDFKLEDKLDLNGGSNDMK
ncbi:DNA polymerase, partial [Linum grandiflorum]